MLYLSSIPMTETVFLAGLAVCFLAILRFQATQQRSYFLLALLACWFMSLTRYDGWFLIPFIALLLARIATAPPGTRVLPVLRRRRFRSSVVDGQ